MIQITMNERLFSHPQGNVGCNMILVKSDCMEVVEVMKNGGNSLGVAVAI